MMRSLDDSGAGREIGGMVHINQVGVVIRSVAGDRMMAPDGSGRWPNIYTRPATERPNGVLRSLRARFCRSAEATTEDSASTTSRRPCRKTRPRRKATAGPSAGNPGVIALLRLYTTMIRKAL